MARTKVQSFLQSLLPTVEVKTDVGVKQTSLVDVGVVLFITATLIIVAYFSMRKIFK